MVQYKKPFHLLNTFSISIILYLINALNISLIASKNLVEIPFRRVLNPNLTKMNDEDLISAFKTIKLHADIEIGTPRQKLVLKIQDDKYFTSIESMDPSRPSKAENMKLYYYNQSSSYIFQKEINYMYFEFRKANYMKETLHLNNKKLDNLTLIQSIELNIHTLQGDESGVLGVSSFNQYERDNYTSNIIKSLKTENLIDSYDFFVHFLTLDKGYIVIGGTQNDWKPSEYTESNKLITKLPIVDSELKWGFIVDKMYYNGQLMDVPSESNSATISLNYGFIGLNTKIKDIFYKDYFKDLIEKNICREENDGMLGIYNFICNSTLLNKSIFPVIKLYNKDVNTNFTIDLSKMFHDVGERSLFLIQFKNSYYFRLGMPFVQYNQFIINSDKQYFGSLGKEYKEPTTKKNNFIFIIIGLVILIIIIVAIIVVYKKIYLKPKKLKAIELDNNDYSLIEH